MPNLISMIRDLHVNHTKPLYTELYGKLLVKKDFFDQQKEAATNDKKMEFETLDITIEMPKVTF